MESDGTVEALSSPLVVGMVEQEVAAVGITPTAPLESDEALIEAIARRDEQAIALLYDRYAGLAFGLAYRILGERGAAEDVVQETWLGVWRRAVTFKHGRGTVRTWLLSIVRHRAIDRLRGTAAHARQDLSLGEEAYLLPFNDPWQEVSLREQRARVRSAIAALPEKQRITIELAYFGGCTQHEIARKMAVPVGTVKGRIRIGLDKLRALLAEASEGAA